MKNFFSILSIMLMSLTYNISVKAQSKTFENVIDVKLQSSVTIKNNNTNVGYAFFYKVDKMKKAALYRLEILDENLKSIGSNEFEGPKNLFLEQALYESGLIMLAFSDPSKTEGYEKFVKVYDLKGKEKGLIAYEPDKVKKGLFGAAIAEQMGDFYNGYSNVEGKGFVCVYQSKAKVGGADIQMIGQNGRLKWERNYSADRGDRMDIYLTATTPDALLFFEADRENIMAKDAQVFLIGLNPDNGKELFRKPMDIGGLTREPMLFKKDNSNNITMISSISHEENKFYSARPIGFNITELNAKTGEMKNSRDFKYESDLSSVLNMTSETKSEDGYIKMHDVVFMKDGSKVLVGEFFRRTVSVLGMAGKILSRGGSGAAASQISIGDLFLMRIDNNNKPVSIEKIEKQVNRVPLPGDGISLGLITRMLTMNREFGYLYTDENEETGKKTVIAEGTFEGERYGTVALTFDEGKGYKLKKFTVQKDRKDRVYLQRAKPGHILITKYNAKEKTINVNLERVD